MQTHLLCKAAVMQCLITAAAQLQLFALLCYLTRRYEKITQTQEKHTHTQKTPNQSSVVLLCQQKTGKIW